MKSIILWSCIFAGIYFFFHILENRRNKKKEQKIKEMKENGTDNRNVTAGTDNSDTNREWVFKIHHGFHFSFHDNHYIQILL